MVWKILRPQSWILFRRLRTTNRVIMFGLILLLIWAGQWTHNNLIREFLGLLSSGQVVTVFASYVPLALMLLLVFSMLGVGDVIHQLYVASDLQILMIAPIPCRVVFLVKLLQCSRATLIPAIGIGTLLLILGVANEVSLGYYPLVVLLVLETMTLATVLVMILVILLARFLPAQKVRSWMPLLLALVMLVLLLGQKPATAWLLQRTNLITFLTEALIYLNHLILLVAGVGGLAFVTSLGAYQLFRTSFHEGWNRFNEVPAQPKPTSHATHRRKNASVLSQSLPAPLRFLLIKEWLEFRRNPRSLLNLAQPLIIVVALVIVPFMKFRGNENIFQPLLFLFMLMSASIFLGLLPIGTSLITIAQEGQTITLLRSVPISMSQVLKAKFWATWFPTAMSWVLVLVAAGLLLQFPFWQIGFLVGITIWGSAGASLATTAIGGLKIEFMVEELRQRMPILISYMIMGLNIIFVLLTIVSSIWLMIRLYPESLTVHAIQGLSGSGTVAWIFSPKVGVPIGLASLQLLFFVGVKLLWDAAVHRLEGWEAI